MVSDKVVSVLKSISLSVLFFIACSSALQAIIVVSIQQVGNDVVVSYDGSWDSFTSNSDATTNAINIASNGMISTDGSNIDRMLTGVTKSSGSWTASGTVASSRSGDLFGFNSSLVIAPDGYTAGSNLSGSITFSNNTLVGLGLTAGDSGSFTGGGNTVNFSVSAIPEPSTYVLISALLIGIATFTIRLKQRLTTL